MSTRPDAAALMEQVVKLPRTHHQVVPPEYMDGNGHMNVMYYTAVGNNAMFNFLQSTGLSPVGFGSRQRGMFALRQVISYLNELREGEEIAVHSGLVDYDSKRIHFIHYIISLTKQRVACTDERVAMYMDLSVRRSTGFEPEILERIEQVQASYAGLGWQPELSGAIRLKKS